MTHDYTEHRNKFATMLGGELPVSPELEQAVIDHFAQNPTGVIAAMKRVGQAHQHGKIRSGWAVLRSELTNAATKRPSPNICPDCETGAGLHNIDCPQAQTLEVHIERETIELTECLGTEPFTHKPCPVCRNQDWLAGTDA